MGAKGNCEYADRSASANSIHCAKLRKRGAKWDYCVCQSFCRVSGKYELTEKTATCKMKDGA